MSQKEEIMITHRIGVLAALMQESLDEIEATGAIAVEFKEKCGALLPFCETMLSEIYQVDALYNGTYMQELSSKVDTVIRKNYQVIQ